jgi:hypothetical protein
LDRFRQVLGTGYSGTVRSASIPAIDLRELGAAGNDSWNRR